MTLSAGSIAATVRAKAEIASRFFDKLSAGSSDEIGITRDPYGPGENFGHEVVVSLARKLGLEIQTDAGANTYMTLPGVDRQAPRIVIGSHMDSVRRGGNFDGAAGVLAGLVATSALQELGIEPNCDISTMAIRAEESVWFQVSYLGSRSSLGTLPAGALDARRIDTCRSAREHIAQCGGDPDALARGEAPLSPANVRAFMELHIEQAPSLVEDGLSVGICTGIPGLFMFPEARVVGEYGHLGTPRRFRRDAAMAAAEFAAALDDEWAKQDASGNAMAVTFGRFHTDIDAHGLTSIAGEFLFSLDVRAYDDALLKHLRSRVSEIVADIEARRDVRFELGREAIAAIGQVSAEMVGQLQSCAHDIGLPVTELKSPASHDAAAFAATGIPTGMIFVRNRNGSHNPAEDMTIDDFLDGTSLLAVWLSRQIS